MKRLCGVPLLLLAAVPAHAQKYDAKGEGARFDAAVVAGRAKADGVGGPEAVVKAVTSGCTTDLLSAKDDWTIDWSTASISSESTALVLKVDMGPDQQFWVRFGDAAQLRTARQAGEHLAAACAG